MSRRISILKTYKATFNLIKANYITYFNELKVPIIILANLQLALVLLSETKYLIDLSLATTWLLTDVMIIGICSRVVVNGVPNYSSWKMAETKIVLQGILLVAFFFVLTLTCLSSFAWVKVIYDRVFPNYNFSDLLPFYPDLYDVSELTKVMLGAILPIYISARCAFVFIGTAIGKKVKFTRSWDLTEYNGWRLVAIITVPISIMIVFMKVIFHFQTGLFSMIYGWTIVTVPFKVFVATSIALIYKNISNEQPKISQEHVAS